MRQIDQRFAQVGEQFSQVNGRLDRTDRHRERSESEVQAKLDLLLGNSIRTRAGESPPCLEPPATEEPDSGPAS